MPEKVSDLIKELAQERFDNDEEAALQGGALDHFKNNVKLEDYLEDAAEFVRRCRAAEE